MRRFYIFKIKQELQVLLKEQPFRLYNILEDIYAAEKKDIKNVFQIFNTVIEPIKPQVINLMLFQSLQANEAYTKFNNTHMINDYYANEHSVVTIYTSHLVLESNIFNPTFLSRLNNISNLFVCDFQLRDYFWLKALQPKIKL